MQDYEEIFGTRGRSYHEAMHQFPHARKQEFQTAIEYLKKERGSTILDIPAGGAYLKKHLPPDITYLAYDFSGEFEEGHASVGTCKESKIDLNSQSVDEIISLAALHHVVARREFFTEMNRILKRGGRFLIADVVAGSRVDPFLNAFLNVWNSMGHVGQFIMRGEDVRLLSSCGFKVDFEERTFDWTFSNQVEALQFFRKLFYLDLNPSDEKLLNELVKLGVRDRGNQLYVKWSLGFLICEKG